MKNKKQEIQHLWDKAVLDYDLHMRSTGHFLAQEKLLEKLLIHFTSPVLDLASGTGFLAGKLLNKGFDVTLNDFSSGMYKFLSEEFQGDPRATISNQDSHEITFDVRFNTIVCNNFFYYLQDRPQAIQSWVNFLNKGGKIVLFEEHPFVKPNTEEMKDHEKSLMELIDPISPEEIEKLFKEKGLKLIKEEKVPIDDSHELYGFIFERSI
ncbi:methyltransferase domain-containing protein [Candidatus Parcubacteria bacterium]|nr:methyltransferase domain-containing protein [Candidatus Parcubacteria bacterium]